MGMHYTFNTEKFQGLLTNNRIWEEQPRPYQPLGGRYRAKKSASHRFGSDTCGYVFDAGDGTSL